MYIFQLLVNTIIINKYIGGIMSKFQNFFLKLLIIFFLLIIFIFISAKSYSQNMFNNISNNFLRLHVVANSDSTEDQILKYKIRDAIIDYITPYFTNIKNKTEALTILNFQKDNITNLATQIASNNGYNYPINVSIGNFYFPTKEYSEIILPEGYYDALKIELGNAKGQNWWCVMFPSICITDSSNLCFSEKSEKLLQENLSEEELSIISNNNTTTDIKIKFKLIELFENI